MVILQNIYTDCIQTDLLYNITYIMQNDITAR